VVPVLPSRTSAVARSLLLRTCKDYIQKLSWKSSLATFLRVGKWKSWITVARRTAKMKTKMYTHGTCRSRCRASGELNFIAILASGCRAPRWLSASRGATQGLRYVSASPCVVPSPYLTVDHIAFPDKGREHDEHVLATARATARAGREEPTDLDDRNRPARRGDDFDYNYDFNDHDDKNRNEDGFGRRGMNEKKAVCDGNHDPRPTRHPYIMTRHYLTFRIFDLSVLQLSRIASVFSSCNMCS